MFGEDWLFAEQLGTIEKELEKFQQWEERSEGIGLTLRKWGYLFWTTLLIGTVAGMIAGAIIKAFDDSFVFLGVEVGAYEWVFMVFGASMISVLSQMGFFAYLTLRFIAISFFRRKMVYWTILQALIVAIAFFDVAYLRYTGYEGEDKSVLGFLILPIMLLLVGLAISYWKMKQTNSSAFIPTLFFMTVVTIIEAVPAFNLDDTGGRSYVIFMVVPLIVCNAWQIMQLHKITQPAATQKELTN
ncbi:KinB-signaling pathway activation protein [Paenibacillus koleovorans]|uniref:KinB-signaling pathway activation protein n=1 Tax=Paenibacillus koleovorans TaxID=121608 RepID=UPI001FEB5321|nr:KinB-signaling pathway activation protein [Paenibacillus koleovorans]